MQFRNFLRVATPLIIAVVALTAVFVAAISEKSASAESDETVYYLLTDHLGSVDVVLDEEGNVVERRDYLPYGSARAEVKGPAAPVEIFKIGSDLAVENGGKNASVQIHNDVYATELWTYHYNGGQGAPGGTIKMLAADGTVYGPWSVDVRNTYYWVATVNQNIPAGSYTIIDSDPGTWSQNGDTQEQGMTWMMGIE